MACFHFCRLVRLVGRKLQRVLVGGDFDGGGVFTFSIGEEFSRVEICWLCFVGAASAEEEDD